MSLNLSFTISEFKYLFTYLLLVFYVNKKSQLPIFPLYQAFLPDLHYLFVLRILSPIYIEGMIPNVALPVVAFHTFETFYESNLSVFLVRFKNSIRGERQHNRMKKKQKQKQRNFKQFSP